MSLQSAKPVSVSVLRGSCKYFREPLNCGAHCRGCILHALEAAKQAHELVPTIAILPSDAVRCLQVPADASQCTLLPQESKLAPALASGNLAACHTSAARRMPKIGHFLSQFLIDPEGTKACPVSPRRLCCRRLVPLFQEDAFGHLDRHGQSL